MRIANNKLKDAFYFSPSTKISFTAVEDVACKWRYIRSISVMDG